MRIADIEGIGPAAAESLGRAGVTTTEHLLERGARPAGRRELAEAAGVPTESVLEWVNRADLMRIKGVGSEYSDLLEAAGVDSPVELARRNAANLAARLAALVEARPEIVRRVPLEPEVAGWIDQAKSLPRAVFHDGAGAEGGGVAHAAATMATTAPIADASPALAESPKVAASAPAIAESPKTADADAMDARIAAEATPPRAPTSAAPTMAQRPAAPSGQQSTGTTAPRPAATPPPTHKREGLWFRIKRMLHLG